MIGGIRVENFRSFVDSGELELKPLTVFVGRNSSGKSSILRLLPLLKQSVIEETREPILWFGGVDFGSFKQAKSRFSESNSISFEFLFHDISRTVEEEFYSGFGERLFFSSGTSEPLFLDQGAAVRIKQELTGSDSGEGVRVSLLAVSIGDDKLVVSVNEEGRISEVRFNEYTLDQVATVTVVNNKRGFYPLFVDQSRASASYTRTRAFVARDNSFFTALLRALDPIFHHRTKDSGKGDIARQLEFGTAEAFKAHLGNVFSSTRSRIDTLYISNRAGFEKLRGLVLLRNLPEIVRRASRHLDKFCASVKYIEPVRARASRYYRYQELGVDDIASDGANVPMFLHSLSSSEREHLENWLSASLGFAVSAERSGDGHIQLLVRESGAEAMVNLADTGFGYSQILPIALQLWKMNKIAQDALTQKRRRDQKMANTIAIEQPELHLHPQMQALLGDLFVLSLSAAREAGASLQLVLETHSEHLINRIGELIDQGKISSEEVVVYVFERESINASTSVRRVSYSATGYLSDPWPLGFFLPDVNSDFPDRPDAGLSHSGEVGHAD